MVGFVRTFLLGLAVSLLLAAPAYAELRGKVHSRQSGLPTAAVAHVADGQLWAEIRVAEKYWVTQGLTTSCPTIHARIAPYPWEHDGPVDGWTTGYGTCDLAITPGLARITRRALWKWAPIELAQECGRVVHEYGHGALGLTHDDERFPIMADGAYDEAIPRECRTWARENRMRVRRELRSRP